MTIHWCFHLVFIDTVPLLKARDGLVTHLEIPNHHMVQLIIPAEDSAKFNEAKAAIRQTYVVTALPTGVWLTLDIILASDVNLGNCSCIPEVFTNYPYDCAGTLVVSRPNRFSFNIREASTRGHSLPFASIANESCSRGHMSESSGDVIFLRHPEIISVSEEKSQVTAFDSPWKHGITKWTQDADAILTCRGKLISPSVRKVTQFDVFTGLHVIQ